MTVFVINLHKDTTRRIFMEQQLIALGLSYEIVSATDGRTLSESDKSTIYDANAARALHGHELSDTQIGCADSHRRVYQLIKERNLPWALVLEDDVQLNPRITSILHDDFISQSRADWLQIDYLPFNQAFIYQWWRASISRIKRQPFFLVYVLFKLPFLFSWGFYEFWREKLARTKHPRTAFFPRPLYLASAYIITAAGVEKILPLTNPIRFAADQVQNRARLLTRLRMRGVVPLLAVQDRRQFSSNLLYDNQ